MFTDKTIALAEQLMKVQSELKASIKEDLKAVNGTLCTMDGIQLWVDDIGVTEEGPFTLEQVKAAIGVPVDDSDTSFNGCKYLRYKIGTVDAVTIYDGKDI